MTFKCPRCKREFGYDREGLFNHLRESALCGKEAIEVFAVAMEKTKR